MDPAKTPGNLATGEAAPAEPVATMLDGELHRKARIIKAHRGLSTISDAILTYGGPGIDREYRTVCAEITAEHADLGGES